MINSFFHSFLGKSSQILFLNACGIILGYGVQIGLIKWMGSREYGVFCYVNSIAAMAGVIVALGLPVAAIRYVSEYIAKKKYSYLKGFLSFGGWLVFFCSVCVGLGLSVLNSEFQLFAAVEEQVVTFGLVVGLPISALCGWQFEVMRGQQRVVAIAWVQNLISPALLILICWIVFQGNRVLVTIDVLLVIALLGFFAWFIFLFVQTKKTLHYLVNVKKKYAMADWLGVSFPLALSSIFLVIMAQIDVFLIGGLIDAKSVAIYSLAAKVGGIVCIFLNTINMIVAPMYVEMYAKGKQAEMQSFASRLAHIIFWPSLFMFLILVFVGKPILTWFGSEFSEAYPALLFLAVGQLFNAASGSVGYLSDLTGLQVKALKIRGACALLNIILSWIFIDIWGVSGAASSTALCLFLWNYCLHHLVSTQRDISPSIWFAMRELCRR